ncbi:GMC oxidoreductase [Nonomuraea africana]|uniref:Glucose-methanol-choline oxidoreductase C-terminal domain-containing protein n=1 Tax=Nonomuraea africana TaxID=46171 RepID=A0ABR9KJ87_9ACTN|nr:GMC oxidoreductase [Nonomuraea africana]MBE1562079.1 hypothetical protein [Nonomuraea africana]
MPPLLDPDYLSDVRDLDAMVAGLRLARQLGNAAGLDPWRGEEVLPRPGLNKDGTIRAYLRRNPNSFYHYAGTCRIGTDDMAVVDPDLHVRGIRADQAFARRNPTCAHTDDGRDRDHRCQEGRIHSDRASERARGAKPG